MHRHAKDVHGLEEKGHKCPHCFKMFPSSQQLGQHSLVHTNIRKYTCKFCDKTFKQLSHVQQHQRIHTGEKPYKCPGEGCEKAFAQLSNLQNHMKQHEKEANGSGPRDLKKPFSCHICQRRFATESSLNNHISKVHSGVADLTQPPSPRQLHSSVAQPHDLTCQVCEKQCYSTDRFYKHMHKYHPDYWRVFAGDRPLSDFINPEIRHREKPFMCQICNKKYSHETGLSKHLVTHPEYRNDPNFKGAELFTCPVCEKLFTRENYLERHMEMKHDEEHARAYEIYKQKYIRKPQPPPGGGLENTGDQAVPTLEGPTRPNPMLPQQALPLQEPKENHMSPPFPMDNNPGNVNNAVRAATISRPPPESPSDSEIEDGSRRKESMPDSRGLLPSHSESFHSDTSFERSSPGRQSHPSLASKMDTTGAGGHWNETNSARASPRVPSDTQHQPYDMSQRPDMLPSSKAHPAAPVRSASVSLPVFPDSFERHMKDKDSPDEPGGGMSRQSQKSYLYRHMSSLDEDQLRSLGTANYVDRQMAHDAAAHHQVSYDQFVRDQMMDEHRTSEKAEGAFSQRNGNKQGLSRNEHYLPESDERRVTENFFSPQLPNQRPNAAELTNHRPAENYMDRPNNRVGLSKASPPDSNTHLHEEMAHMDRHFPYARSPGHDPVGRSLPNQEHPRLLPPPPPPGPNEDASRYDYPHYNTHGLLSPGHAGLPRERFPFNLPPSSLPPATFAPHPMSPRPSLSGQYPPLGHRSDEEVAQALESLARAMRPAYR